MIGYRAWIIGLLSFLALVLWAAFHLADALLPLFLSFAMAYAFSPLVDALEARGMPRAVSVTLLMAALFLAFILLLLSFVPALVEDAVRFINGFPDYLSRAVRTAADIGERFGIRVPVRQEEIMARVQAYVRTLSLSTFSIAANFLQRIFSGAAGAAIAVLNLLLVPLFFFFFLRDLPALRVGAEGLVPPRHREPARAFAGKVDRVLAGYIRGQLTVSLVLGIFYAVGLSLLGVNFALLIGLLAGFLNIIPYLGQITGLILATIMALVDFTGWGRLLAVPALFGLANFLEGFILTPRVVGNKVGLSQVQTIIAVIVGGEAGGFFGMIVAIPAAGILKIILQDAVEAYRRSPLYGGPAR